MPLVAQIFAGIAAALHVLFFYLESVVFTKKGTYKSFGLATKEEAEIVKPMALNQGFYNLFLAVGVIVGVVLSETRDKSHWVTTNANIFDESPDHEKTVVPLMQSQWAEPLVVFGCACMLAAAVVLLISTKGKLLRGAAIQGIAPAIALIAIAVG